MVLCCITCVACQNAETTTDISSFLFYLLEICGILFIVVIFYSNLSDIFRKDKKNCLSFDLCRLIAFTIFVWLGDYGKVIKHIYHYTPMLFGNE